MTANICRACGASNPSEAKFCSSCGTPLAHQCKNCGSENSLGARFCMQCGESLASKELKANTSTLADRILESRENLSGERKYITILFADVLGSTSALVGLDPEEAREKVEPTVMSMIEAVRQNNGTITKVMGDGIMALFGAPIADEKHAINACQAALDMIEQCHGRMPIRVGVHSGKVVVIHVGQDGDIDAIGDAVNFAARLEQFAKPNTICTSVDFARNTQSFIRSESLGLQKLKGFAEPQEIYRVIGIQDATESRRRWNRIPLIGRQREVRIIDAALVETSDDLGQVISITGEAGTGKSKLVFEVSERAQRDGWIVISAQATSASQGAADSVVSQLLTLLMGCGKALPTAEFSKRLEKWLAMKGDNYVSHSNEVRWLLGLTDGGKSFQTVDEIEAMRTIAMRMFQFIFHAEAKDSSVLIVLEDLHWLDTSSRAILEDFIPTIAKLPIMILTTSRPNDLEVLASRRVDTRQLQLNALNGKEADALMSFIMGSDPTLSDLKTRISERTGNNPFFIEEVIESLIESKLLQGNLGRLELVGKVQELNLPASISTVVEVRLDRLSEQQRIAINYLSVLNQPTTSELLGEMCQIESSVLDQYIKELQQSGFISEEGNLDQPEIGLSHSIIRDVAYNGLLREKRRKYHRSVFDCLQSSKLSSKDCDPRIMGHHAFEATQYAEAAVLLANAGKQAYRRSAYAEARDILIRAAEAIEHLSEDQAQMDTALEINLDLRDAYFALGQLDGVAHVLDRALKIVKTQGDKKKLAHIYTLKIHHFLSVGEQQNALTSADQALDLANKIDDRGLGNQARFYRLQIFASLGRYVDAISDANHVMAILQSPDGIGAGKSSMMLSLCRMWALWCAAELGNFSESSALLMDAQNQLMDGDDSNHSKTELIHAALGCGLFWLRRGMIEPDVLKIAVDTLYPAYNIAKQYKLAAWVPAVASPLGYALTLSGHAKEALPILQEAVDKTYSRHGAGNALRLCHLAFAYLELEELARAEELCDEALSLARKSGENGHEAYVLEVRGQIFLNAGNVSQGKNYIEQSAKIAIKLGMAPLVHRCDAALHLI